MGGLRVRLPVWLFEIFALSSPGVYSAYNRNEFQGISRGGKVLPQRKADSSAALVVPKLKIKLENTSRNRVRTLPLIFWVL